MTRASEVIPTRIAAERGLAYLLRCQHPAGSFTDFWLPVGTSDAWVTAYVGLALHAVSGCSWLPDDTRALTDAAARRAARWLLDHAHPRGGWGYNASVSADADSTAHALSLLARLNMDIPAQAVAFLNAHRVDDVGFCTYAWPSSSVHLWTQPCPDVSAAALRCLHDLGELTQTQLQAAWLSMVGGQQQSDGLWEGYWWPSPAYPTGLALEVWNTAGRPPLRWVPARWPVPESGLSAFDLAWSLRAQTLLDGTPSENPDLQNTERTELAAQLLTLQAADGAWPSSPLLRVPPAHPTSGGVTLRAQDTRRVFTSASVLRALVLGAPDVTAPTEFSPFRQPRQPISPPHPDHSPLTKLVWQVAQAAGFPPTQAAQARDLFGHLTRLSLRPPAPWPSRQLTALSGGMPLEFSATVGAQVGPALRYATEVSDPYLPPPARVQSGLTILREVAETVGYQDSWQRLWPAVRLLTAPMPHAPDGTRFTVWGGVDQAAAMANQLYPPPALKLYLNTLHRELGGGRPRVADALHAAQLPVTPLLQQALTLLDAAGFPQELGFALGPRGQVACKVYYELSGWRPALVQELLQISNLPGLLKDLTPDIPGLIRVGLATKSRAGIGVRLDPSTGQITELMTACAFPTPFLPLQTTVQRVENWLEAQSGDAAPYRALVQAIRPTWPDHDAATRAMHSLFTRTVSVWGNRTTIYLRPMLALEEL
ncbi:hypothetical protein E7T06_20245 [Deinococcus sp. Arct2-2]|uniref:prenyltransferase/squalene oxidase repeat-containing protein n=1 Tax=Deinococcus sp. Arct2-2 TaxID=2568653 RepID=UPI0010A43130|nr:prenyltransferase/squalene oxidase repeat-containing protein [Deinococcus sp. Arct2-2]THF66794.1 hypothetical protein E7T06_20245 [Deinococcus sp. Arct2-2]